MSFSGSPETTNHRLLLLHRLPRFKTMFFSKLRTRYRILDPLDESDPSFLHLSSSVRLMLCVGPSPVTSETLDTYPSLECIVGTSAGFDHFDLAECRRRNIRVTTAGDSFSDDVADFAVGLLIDVLRGVSAADRFVRAGSWPVIGELSPPGYKVGGKRVGIVGLGSIGTRVSKRLEVFGCSIAYTSRRMKPNVPFPFHSNIHDLAVNSDVLILCCALTEETHHIVDKEVLTALGKEGIVVNVGRGALVDEKELVEFLKRGEIGGAGLDVYENEPHVPEELFGLDNVVLSPHLAVLTPESMEALEELFTYNLEAFFSNKPLRAQIEYE
ncbi:PREDICTED: glyoxylate/hydroxypyruvate reductase HPR3-like [Nicotiana attenuata]|uniref:Glyoxylatehydroxypyruvate reductase hpr3 n=1 Tax=Nicotiana attenuata TaxID=49451 RepID=A0A314KH51_NICAT|nr:PREDICTED: glyoxylate/hydroxypyruvate reductase HPR3-like [Nicotiana attenuata]OIT28655.1 glyoxylatehydroxypyruvate reductase hpr3 [Nicotiana attenuata]